MSANGNIKPARGPAEGKFAPQPTSARQDEFKAWARQEAEGKAICDAYNARPDRVGILSCGWAFKGFGFRLDISPQEPPSPPASFTA